jgi:ubiquinone/menaquinone biosynthesis C-methylase UbiE
MTHLKKTQETYRQIAAAYAQAQSSRAQLARHIDKFVAFLPVGGTVLDVGCGPGMDTAVFQSQQLTAIGLDYSHEMMRVGRDEHGCNVPFARADMRHLPIGQKVDGIWSCASLLHLDRKEMLPTLQGFWRVLKPGGILYLSLKVGSGEAWVKMQNYGHGLPRFFTYWQAEALDALLETAVFHILEAWEEDGKKDRWLVRYAQKREVVP